MNKIVFALAALIVGSTQAEYIKGYPGMKRSSKDPRAVMRGGFLEKPQNGKSVFVVNAQKRVSREGLRKAIDLLARNTRSSFTFIDGDSVSIETADAAKRKLGAPAALFVIDDARLAMPMVVAPELSLAIINVAAMGRGSEKPAYIESRTRKELVRAFLYACGGVTSTYQNNLMDPITKISSLDDFADDMLPQDIVGRTMKFLPSIGVEPNGYVSYEKACAEGWAPAPTNDIQKAIWDKVHAIPTEPIKIKPETKKMEK